MSDCIKDEIWRDIPGFEGYYKVSSKGRVQSLPRTVKCIDDSCRTYKGKLSTPHKGQNGYLTVSLSKEGKTCNHNVHVLVAMAFLDHTPQGMKVVVDHIDNNQANNSVENLQLTTQRHNTSKDKSSTRDLPTGVRKIGKSFTSEFTVYNIDSVVMQPQSSFPLQIPPFRQPTTSPVDTYLSVWMCRQSGVLQSMPPNPSAQMHKSG